MENDAIAIDTEHSTTDYSPWLELVDEYAVKMLSWFPKVFVVQTESNIVDTYLDSFPESDRQHYNCNTCKRSLSSYGKLVAIDEKGELMPIMWDPELHMPFWGKLSKDLHDLVKGGTIVHQFFSDKTRLEPPHDKTYEHIRISEYKEGMPKGTVKTPNQLRAESKENHRLLTIVVNKVRKNVLDELYTLVDTALERTTPVEAFLKQIETLLIFKDKINKLSGKARVNLIWSAAANSSALAHVNGSVLGKAVKELERGDDFNLVLSRIKERLAAHNYKQQRVVKNGQLDNVAKIIEKAGLEKAFHRRAGRLEDIPEDAIVWRSTEVGEPVHGVMDTIKSLKKDTMKPAMNIESDKALYLDMLPEVLKDAVGLELFVLRVGYTFFGSTMAMEPTGANLYEDPFSLYRYVSNDEAHTANVINNATRWNLGQGFVKVDAIFKASDKLHFALEGCRDCSDDNSIRFTPAGLIPALHEHRHAIKAIADATPLQGNLDEQVAGIRFESDYRDRIAVKITRKDGKVITYSF